MAPVFRKKLAIHSTLRRIKSIVQSQMFLEESVVRDPPPDVQVASFPNGMFIDIAYTQSDSREESDVSFPVGQVGLNG